MMQAMSLMLQSGMPSSPCSCGSVDEDVAWKMTRAMYSLWKVTRKERKGGTCQSASVEISGTSSLATYPKMIAMIAPDPG